MWKSLVSPEQYRNSILLSYFYRGIKEREIINVSEVVLKESNGLIPRKEVTCKSEILFLYRNTLKIHSINPFFPYK